MCSRLQTFRNVFILSLLLFGCTPRVNISAIDNFRLESKAHSGNIDVSNQGDQLIADLYILMKANEGVIVPICESAKELRECRGDGFSVFVLGGFIPGFGHRTVNTYSNTVLSGNRLSFTKDNSSTTFIGTPMFTRENDCQVYAKNGGLQVEMTKYYANWAGVGNMFMAEGWAIVYFDFEKGIIGLQLDLDISGLFTLGGGSRYVLLQFPNVPPDLSQSKVRYNLIPN